MTTSLLEFVTLWINAAPWLTTLWIAAAGACIGSFLNVVVYRLPAGMSLVHPGSRCPHCGHAIRAHDNIPVLSWLILRGRCRDCGANIASRYPAVEAGVALCLAIQWWVDVNGQSPALVAEATVARQLVVFLLHASLVCTLLAAALIDRDGHPVPRSIAGPLAVVVVLSCLVRPDALRSIRPVADPGTAFVGWRILLDAAWGSLLAAVCTGRWSGKGRLVTLALLGGLSGLVLGGFAAGVLSVVASALCWACSRHRPAVTWPLLLAGATAVYQLASGVRGLEFAWSRTGWLSWVLLGLAVLSLGALGRRRQKTPDPFSRPAT